MSQVQAAGANQSTGPARKAAQVGYFERYAARKTRLRDSGLPNGRASDPVSPREEEEKR